MLGYAKPLKFVWKTKHTIRTFAYVWINADLVLSNSINFHKKPELFFAGSRTRVQYRKWGAAYKLVKATF